MTQRMTLIRSPLFTSAARLDKITDLRELFDPSQPLCLEIGCGIGDFVVQLAARHPDKNFIAIDIFNQGCLKTCTRLENAGLSNVRVVRTEARSLLLKHLPPQSLSALYINCPDPWPKKRHRKRRLVDPEFLQLVRYFLHEGGDFHFCTDFVDYGLDVAAALNAAAGFENCLSTPYTHELGTYPISKYMRRFLDKGQPIYYCHYRRQPGFVAAPPPPHKGFRLPWGAEPR